MAGYYIDVCGVPWSIPVWTGGAVNDHVMNRYYEGAEGANVPIVPPESDMVLSMQTDQGGNFVNDPIFLTKVWETELYYRMDKDTRRTIIYYLHPVTKDYVLVGERTPSLYNQINNIVGTNAYSIKDMGFCLTLDLGTARGVFPTGDRCFPRLCVAFMYGVFAQQLKYDPIHQVHTLEKATLLRDVYSIPSPLNLVNTANPAPLKDWWSRLGYNKDSPLFSCAGYCDSSSFNIGGKMCQDGVLPIDEASYKEWLDSTYRDDPYAPIDPSQSGGGDGNFHRFSENINIPDLPSINAVDTGFITMYAPNTVDLHSLASYMWNSSIFDLNQFKKLFANPMDAILGLTIVPCEPIAPTRETVAIGNIDTGINMPRLASQWQRIDMGTIDCYKFFGSYLDYDPYTKIDIYLPFIGIRPLKMDDVMGKSINLVYHVDFLSGSCVAFIACNDSVLYTFTGQLAGSVPINGNDMTNVVNGMLAITGTAVGAVASGGATLGASLLSSAHAVMGMKPQIERGGNASSITGLIAHQRPFLIFAYPNVCLPSSQSHLEGYPSFVTKTLGDCKGYVEVYKVQLTNIDATEDEKGMIEALLKEGVFV